MNEYSSKLVSTCSDNHARVMDVTTPHGDFQTPCFMPVGTRAGVNCMTANELRDEGSQIILGGNTYHMLVAPGMAIIHQAGGMHPFMNWQGPMLTDSGGFQVFSLSKKEELCTIDEKGAHFKHPVSGEAITMTPEVSLQTQKTIGADIIMAFDQCTPDIDDKEKVIHIMQRTHRWLAQSKAYHEAKPNSDYGNRQALFGIIQGGNFRDLREQSCEFVLSQDLDGIAIGGETVGFDMEKTVELVGWLRPMLPDNKVRYTMGVGLCPQDLFDVVKAGVDIFDCVAPTRNARHGALYSGTIVKRDDWFAFESEYARGQIQIKRQDFAIDERPVMESCTCSTCKNYSRAALHYLFKQKSVLFATLASVHNISVMQQACDTMRSHILKQPALADLGSS